MGFFSSIGGFLKDTAGSIISAGSNLVGGLLGNSSASSINQSNQNFAREQFEYQKALHQNQLQWRVEDAKKAGLHPLAGIGVQAPSFSPVSASTTPLDYSWIGDLGQSANYGATKAKDRKQQAQMLDLQVRGLELDNEYKQAQIDALKVDTLASSIASNQALEGPANPTLNATESQGDSPPFNNNTFGNRAYNLYSLGHFGDMVLTALNPDIADSLTESQISHLSATLMRDIEYYRNPRIKMDAFKHLSKAQQKAVVDGRATFEYVPAIGGFMLTYPQRRYSDGSVGGKLRFE